MSRRVESCSEPGTTRTSKIRPAGRSPNVICVPSENSKTSRFGHFNILKTASASVLRWSDACSLSENRNRTLVRSIRQTGQGLGASSSVSRTTPIRMPMHLLDSKALSRLGLYYLVRILSREPAHTFILRSGKLSQPSSLWKRSDGRLCFGDFRLVPRRERGCRGGFGGSGAYYVALEV